MKPKAQLVEHTWTTTAYPGERQIRENKVDELFVKQIEKYYFKEFEEGGDGVGTRSKNTLFDPSHKNST